MRPRISQREAAYLVEVLTEQREQLQQRLLDLKELEANMSRIIFDLSHRVQAVYDDTDKTPYNYVTGRRIAAEYRIVGDREALNIMHIYDELKKEHPHIRAEQFNVWDYVRTHEKLIAKYQAIANGEPHDGRYKKLSLAHASFPSP